MALRYNTQTRRFFNDTTGRFVSGSRGRQSSIARAEFEAYQIKEFAPGAITFPLEREAEFVAHEKLDIKQKEDTVKDYLDDLFEEWEDDFEDFDLDKEDRYR